MTIVAWLLMAVVGVPLALIGLVLACIAIAHLVDRDWFPPW